MRNVFTKDMGKPGRGRMSDSARPMRNPTKPGKGTPPRTKPGSPMPPRGKTTMKDADQKTQRLACGGKAKKKYAKGGKVRGAGICSKGVRPAKSY